MRQRYFSARVLQDCIPPTRSKAPALHFEVFGSAFSSKNFPFDAGGVTMVQFSNAKTIIVMTDVSERSWMSFLTPKLIFGRLLFREVFGLVFSRKNYLLDGCCFVTFLVQFSHSQTVQIDSV